MKLRAELTVLPPREQARRLAAIAAVLVAQIERTEPDARETKAALAAIRTWGDGGRLTGRYFSDLIYSDDEHGTLRSTLRGSGKAQRRRLERADDSSHVCRLACLSGDR